MKIFFRYLFMRLLQPFLITLSACTVIWIMADLYGNIDDFLEHKVNILLILRFYILQIPSMLVQVLPATLLFSTLFTLLALNRRSETTALQAGGLAPIWLFSPFLFFALLTMIVLFIDMYAPAAQAEVTRERLLKQVKGQSAGRDTFVDLPYVDTVNKRVWFFSKLTAHGDQGSGRRVELLQRDAEGHDMEKYSANEAEWTGEFWRFRDLVKTVYSVNGSVQEKKAYQELDLPDVNTPPQQLSLIISQPEQLTVSQLSSYIATSTQSEENLAKFRTEWWYRILYPFSLLVLVLYALLQGNRTDRRSAVTGVVGSIGLLLAYTFIMHAFMAIGSHNRMPAFLSVAIPELVFGGVGLHLLATQYGWWWQIHGYWKKWQEQHAEDEEAEAA
jgi:lipopolysaccharide export system permease protein